MNTETLRRHLQDMGTDEVPEPRLSFVTALEEELRRTTAPLPVPTAPGLAPSPRRGRPASSSSAPGRDRQERKRPTFPGLALAAACVAFLAVAVVRPAGTEAELRVATAIDAYVVLPDGTIGAAAPGLVVPDGTRIVTGSEGHVSAGRVELGPNSEAVVNGGVLDPDPAPALAVPTVTSPPATAPPPAAPPIFRETTPVKRPTPTTTPAAAADPAKPTPTGEPTPTTVAIQPTGPKTVAPTEPDHAEPTPAAPVTLKLEAIVHDDGTKLRWSPYQGPGFAAYLVLRADTPAEPHYPLDEHTTLVAWIADQQASGRGDPVPNPDQRAYRVVAVDRERRVLAVSPVVHPVVPERKTAEEAPDPGAASANPA